MNDLISSGDLLGPLGTHPPGRPIARHLPPIAARQPPQLAHRSTYMWQHAGAVASDNRFTIASHFNPATIDGGEGVGRFLPWSLRAKHPEWFWPVLPAGAAISQIGKRFQATGYTGSAAEQVGLCNYVGLIDPTFRGAGGAD